MITYDLAKELKDAGFPQNEDFGDPRGRWVCSNGETVDAEDLYGGSYHTETDEDTIATVPTLSELIEACVQGEAFFDLKREMDTWIASSPKGDISNWVEVSVNGSTPEEAVARLWLALQGQYEEAKRNLWGGGH